MLVDTLARLLFLLRQVWLGIAYTWWLSVAVCTIAAAALVVRAPWTDRSFRRLVWSAVALLAIPLALILAAAAFANEDPYRHVSSLRAAAVLATFAVDAVLAAGLVWFARGYRIRASALALACVWLTAWSAFIAAMSITGNWL